MAPALVHLGTDQIQHVVQQSPSLITMGHHQRRLAADTNYWYRMLDQCRSTKIDRHWADMQWTWCGAESVPRMVLTLSGGYALHL